MIGWYRPMVVSLFLVAILAVGCDERPAGGTGVVSSVEKAVVPAGEEGSGLAMLTDEERDIVLATIDGRPITLGEFQDRLDNQSPYIRARYNSIERKKEFLDNLIRFELLAMEAEKRGYASDPDVVRSMKQVMIQKLMKEEFEAKMKLDDITEEEMLRYYEEHKDEFHKPAQVRVSHIMVADKATAGAVLEEVKGAGADHKKWRDLVNKHSIDTETKSRGGDLRYFPRPKDGGTVDARIADVAFALEKVGDVAPIVETEKGFHIIKLTGKRKELHRTFEQVKRSIAQRLFREKRTKAFEDFVASLKTTSGIVEHPEHLDKVKVVLGDSPKSPLMTGAPGAPGMIPPGMPPGPGMPPSHPGMPGPGAPTSAVPIPAPSPAATAAPTAPPATP